MRQLMNNIVLVGTGGNGSVFTREFRNIKYISEGASVICYEANYDQSGKGTLKEFWPSEMYALERRPDGHLTYSDGYGAARDSYRQKAEKYLRHYRQLLEIKQQNVSGDLSTFIPHFEIFHGMRPDGRASDAVYIWSPEPKLEVFDNICKKIHRAPDENPEQKLFIVLTAIKSLTECIKALHNAEMVHRDIKPTNFGFVKRGGETLTQTLSMFDIDTICSVFERGDDIIVNEGFSVPEEMCEKASNRSDIYSIGATLFYAVVVTKETAERQYLYRTRYYNRIPELIHNSELMLASELNSHPRLLDVLSRILGKCLCAEHLRYRSCEQLLKDLDEALFYLLPSHVRHSGSSKEKWVLTDIDAYLEASKNKDSRLAIQYHLFQKPLYECLERGESSLNVLIIGLGKYGQNFLDICLQAGQMIDVSLNVTIVSDKADDKNIYLSPRPCLRDFFSVDGVAVDDSYGSLRFETVQFSADDKRENIRIIEKLICESSEKTPPHCIFIAMGSDVLNASAAEACREAAEILEFQCCVNYAVEGGSERPAREGVYPVRMNGDVSKSALYYEIERLAFNVHLVWEKSLNLDYAKVRREFRNKYYHNSCVSNVLSLKSKLYSIGIELNLDNFNEAARLFGEKLKDRKIGERYRRELVWIEHRRWVTEKLTEGWRPVTELSECASGKTKDVRRKRHVCLVRSRPNFMLKERFGNNRSKWDTAKNKELIDFDELDRMSVKLHQMYAKEAKLAKHKNLLRDGNMNAVRVMVESDPLPAAAFLEWYTCVKDIWHGDTQKVQLYKSLKCAFLRSADKYPESRKKTIEKSIAAFETAFYPILAATAYSDWKENDEKLIDQIPFILTFTTNSYLVIPYVTGDNSDFFANVASATVLNPERIIYLYLAENPGDMEALCDSLQGIVNYMNKKNLRSSVDFVMIYTEYFYGDENNYDEAVIRIGRGRIKNIKSIYAPDYDGLNEQLESYLLQRGCGKRFFAAERNNSRLSLLLNVCSNFPSFRFNQNDIAFEKLNGCNMLEYLDKKSFVTVNDIAAFRLLISESNNQPEFFDDYKQLWSKYTENRSNWKSLCDFLKSETTSRDTLSTFKKTARTATAPVIYEYVVPFACAKGIQKILDALGSAGLVQQGTKLFVKTTNSCTVKIIDTFSQREQYDILFCNPYLLMLAEALQISTPRSDMVTIGFNHLRVNLLKLPEEKSESYRQLLQWFAKKNYISNFTAEQNTVSFTYATPSVKELMTTAGRMLEIYTYHSMRATGKFDDVISSHEIEWADRDIKNELDCIATKGFRMLFVECKARWEIASDFYNKLFTLVTKFGVNATAVLVADTNERPDSGLLSNNTIQRKRGNQLNMVTIWDKQEIEDIGKTLLDVINGVYSQ